MRVLICTSTYPLREDDGIPRFVHDLAVAMARSCEIVVLAPGAPGSARHERRDGVDVVRFDYFWPRGLQRLAYGDGIRENLRRSWLARLQPLPFVLAQTAAIRRLLAGTDFDVVNTHWLLPQGLAAALVPRDEKRPAHVLSVHAGDVYLLARMPGGARLSRFVLARTDAVIAAGSHVGSTLQRLAGFSGNVSIQPMGVRLEMFEKQAGSLPLSPFPGGYLLFHGRLVEKKGVRYLLRALPPVRRCHPGLGLVIAGSGPLERALRAEARDLGVANAVHFTGRLPHRQVVRYLLGCKVAVVPSIVDSRGETEGMPTTVVEALAAAKPVVACNVDGIPDVIDHGRNGWLCAPNNPEELAARILEAIEPHHAEKVSAAARRAARHHDWRQVARRYIRIFEQTLQPGGQIGGHEAPPT